MTVPICSEPGLTWRYVGSGMMRTTLRRSPHVLIIDDDQGLLESYAVLLEDEFRVYTAATGEDGLACLQREDIDLLLLDLRLPSMDGLEVLRRAKVIDDRVAVIVITALNEARLAAEAFKLGVAEYLVKPFDIKPTLALLRRILKCRQEASDVPRQLEEVTSPLPPDFLVGRASQMRQLLTLLSRVAETDATVLISGETGVGKELIARALHQQSRRHTNPFTVVNCAAITEPLAESILFGHERGAFTGAVTRHRGAFERAQTGTLFLDEIGSLRLEVQAKLLRVLQERTFERVGGRQPCTSMCVSSRPQTKTCVIRWPWGSFGRTCSTGCRWYHLRCPHFATVLKISHCSSATFCASIIRLLSGISRD